MCAAAPGQTVTVHVIAASALSMRSEGARDTRRGSGLYTIARRCPRDSP